MTLFIGEVELQFFFVNIQGEKLPEMQTYTRVACDLQKLRLPSLIESGLVSLHCKIPGKIKITIMDFRKKYFRTYFVFCKHFVVGSIPYQNCKKKRKEYFRT